MNTIEVSGAGKLLVPDGWSADRLGSMVVQRHDIVAVEDDNNYPLIGVRWYAEGAFIREVVTSASTSATRFYRAHPGDLIYNRLFAWKGSFGILPDETEGAYTSNEFPMFTSTGGNDIRYVCYYLMQPWVWDLIEAESTGATPTSRNRWKESSLRNLVVARPPHSEQIRIADHLDSTCSKINRLLHEFSAPASSSNGTLADLIRERRGALITDVVTGQMEIA